MRPLLASIATRPTGISLPHGRPAGPRCSED